MKSFGKIVSAIAAVLLLLGIVLVIIGYSYGGRLVDHLPAYVHWGRYDDNDGYDSSDYEDEDLIDFSKSYSDIKKISMDIGAAELVLRQGTEFSIKASDVAKEYFKSEVRNGVWTIEDNRSFRWFRDSWFGIGHREYAPKITVYIPKEFVAEDIEIVVNAGTIDIEEIVAKNVDLDVGAGSVNVDKLVATNKIKLSVDAGEIQIEDLDASDMTADCGVGSIKLDGRIVGKSDIECNVGEVRLNLDGNKNDYNYDIDCQVGSIIIDNNKYSFDKTEHISNDGTIGDFDLVCNVGSIKITFNE